MSDPQQFVEMENHCHSPSECQRITNCWIWSKDLQLMSFKHWIEKMHQQKMMVSVAGFGEFQVIFKHIFTLTLIATSMTCQVRIAP